MNDATHINTSYAIRSGNGIIPGKRSINYVWYDRCPASSSEFQENLTDIEGVVHGNTLPKGKMRPETWQRQRSRAKQIMTPCFLELVNKTTLSFVSAVRDRQSRKASCLDGKVIFVEEALTLMRPHTGMSFNHSAINCMMLQKVLQGDLTLRDWETQMLQWVEWNSLLANAVGTYFIYFWSSKFMWNVLQLIFVLLRQRLFKLFDLFRAKL